MMLRVIIIESQSDAGESDYCLDDLVASDYYQDDIGESDYCQSDAGETGRPVKLSPASLHGRHQLVSK